MSYHNMITDIKSKQKLLLRKSSILKIDKDPKEVYGLRDSSPDKVNPVDKEFQGRLKAKLLREKTLNLADNLSKFQE